MYRSRAAVRDAGAIDSAELQAACAAAVASAVAEQDARDAIEAALDALHGHVSGLFVSVLLPEHGHLWVVSSRGYPALPDGIAVHDGIVARAARTGRAQLVLDVAADPDYVHAVDGITSELAMPLENRRADVLGVLDIETSRRLPDDARETVRPLADAIAGLLSDAEIDGRLDLSALARLFVFVGSLREPEAIAEVTARSLPRIVPFDVCQVVLGAGADGWNASTWSSPTALIEPVSPAAVAALRERIDTTAVVELFDVAGMRLSELAGTGVRSALLAPLRVGGFDLGTLVGLSPRAVSVDHRQTDVIALLAGHAAASIDASIALTHERIAALTDPLTGLLNRRGFEPRLEELLAECEHEGSPLSLVVLDCDDFKLLNDRAGHEQGDELLRVLAGLLRDALPHGGETGRLGGDEFMVVLPRHGPDEGLAAASELGAALAAGLDDAGFPMGVSLGVATFPVDGDGATPLMRAADQALYEAKAAGKSRAVAFGDMVRRAQAPPSATAEQRDLEARAARDLRQLTGAAAALWTETAPEPLLDRLARSLTFLLGGTGCVISAVEGERLVEVIRHSLREVDLGEDVAYLIEDFPLTRQVLSRNEARAISLLDEDVDSAEEEILRELGMSCCLLAPLTVGGVVWGLVEVYEMRMRRFSVDEVAAASFLVAQAALRLEHLGAPSPAPRAVPTLRPHDA